MMLTFIFGGSASGKSEYAEQYAASLAHNCNAPLFYLATMCANDTESKQRMNATEKCVRTSPFKPSKCPKQLTVLPLGLTAWYFWNACPICWQTRCFQTTQQPTLYPLYYSKSGICNHTVNI